MVLRVVSGEPPRPGGKKLSLGDVPDDLLLRSASAPQRASLLVGLALNDASDGPLREGLRRVASECNALALEQTLELLARRGELGFVVKALEFEWLLALGRARGVEVSDALASTDTVARRGLTRREARYVKENFGGTLDPATVRFEFTLGAQTMGAGAMALGNTIFVDPTDPRFQIRPGTTLAQYPDDESWDSFNGILLAHEPTHVWSYQHQGSRYAVDSVAAQLTAMQTGDRGGAYLYKPDRAHFIQYGEEQRAMIMQDYIAAVRGKATGDTTSLTLYGGTRPVDEVLATLQKYIDQMRALGPGTAEPNGRSAEWILCPSIARGFVGTQDGVAGSLGAQATAVLGTLGRGATQALVQGAVRRDAAQVAAGVAGVAGAVVASVVPREQSSYGATSGGSAVLDQAGLPRGVEVGRDGLTASAKAAWDAPVDAPGLRDARVEWQAGVHRDVGEVRVDADARAVVATAGDVRRAEAKVRLEQDGTSLAVSGGVTPEREKKPGRAWGRIEFESEPVSLELGGAVTTQGGRVQRATADSRVTTKGLSVETETSFARAAKDAPLALEAADVKATAQLAPGVSAGAGVRLVPTGLEGVSAELAAQGDAGSVAVTAAAAHLTSAPSVAVGVTATEKKSGVTVGAKVEATPSKGEVQGGVTVSVPLD
ncbi:MAG: hypothetical protein ACOZQL_28105 [Myxococcota bacterium]